MLKLQALKEDWIFIKILATFHTGTVSLTCINSLDKASLSWLEMTKWAEQDDAWNVELIFV